MVKSTRVLVFEPNGFTGAPGADEFPSGPVSALFFPKRVPSAPSGDCVDDEFVEPVEVEPVEFVEPAPGPGRGGIGIGPVEPCAGAVPEFGGG